MSKKKPVRKPKAEPLSTEAKDLALAALGRAIEIVASDVKATALALSSFGRAIEIVAADVKRLKERVDSLPEAVATRTWSQWLRGSDD